MSAFPKHECKDGKPHLISTVGTNTRPMLFYCECTRCGGMTELCFTTQEAEERGKFGWFVAWRREDA